MKRRPAAAPVLAASQGDFRYEAARANVVELVLYNKSDGSVLRRLPVQRAIDDLDLKA